ncbi:hypothetical protein FQR65_LT20340 [Abscondita terminalis]|nr:hypothetical protein FQR65_LT20340 [Abscondita terminalis]
MAKINLLPWRDELREQKKKQFVAICVGVALIGLATVLLAWFYFDHKLEDQEQANQLVTSTNQNLDMQLKTLDGLQERRNAIIERMKLIQGLQGQRPVIVRLVDELVRVVPAQMYITKFSRVGDKFTIEGKAESPNTVAELLRAAEENKNQAQTSVIPRVEESYGSFVVTVDLGEIASVADDGATKAEQVPAAGGDYHSFGTFVSSVAALPRIVTLHDFTITGTASQDKKSDVPVIDYTIKAKTYRYIGADEQKAQKNCEIRQNPAAPSTPQQGGTPQ